MPSALILGAGPRIGFTVACALKSVGYDVAVGSRKSTDSAKAAEFTRVNVDVADPASVQAAFDEVSKTIGVPSVVVYNAAGLTLPTDGPFSVSNEEFARDLNVNVVGAYASLRAAVNGWKNLADDDSGPKAFIATGNVIPWAPSPPLFTLGSGKAALAHLIETAAMGYEKEGYRFYFASQILEGGAPVPYNQIDAEAHARVYKNLVLEEKKHWDVRFVN